MSKKRSKTTESRSLRAVVDAQLAAAAEEIFWLLKERRQADVEQLKRLVAERITAAVNNIFTVFEATRAAEREPEEPGQRLRAEPAAGRTGQCPDTDRNTVSTSGATYCVFIELSTASHGLHQQVEFDLKRINRVSSIKLEIYSQIRSSRINNS